MAYLLDSNLVIPYLADDPVTVPLVERLAPEGINISIISYLEAFQDTLRSFDPVASQERFDRFLAVVLVLPLSLAVAMRCASLREMLRQQGRRVRARALDLVMAATALEYELKFVTRNIADFADIPGLVLHQST